MLRKIIFDQARENWLAYRAARMDQPGERALSELLLNELYAMNGENLTAAAAPPVPEPVVQPAAQPRQTTGLTPRAAEVDAVPAATFPGATAA